jgi:tetratricopeptide (TPR) repeat protein
VRLLSAQLAYLMGEVGRVVGLLEGALLPETPQERIDMLLLLATGTVAERGAEGLSTALDHLAQAERLTEDNPVPYVMCKKARFLCFYFGADERAAAVAAEEGVAFARRAGLRYEESAQLHNAGEQYLRMGEYRRARAALTQSLEIAEDIGTDRVRGVDEALLAYIDDREGDAGAAGRLATLAAKFRASNNAWYELNARYWLGLLHAKKRDPSARPELERALELAHELRIRAHEEECGKALSDLDRTAPKPE